MKILFDHPCPLILAHGGFQTQIEQTKKALKEIGVDVEYLKWWDDTQRPDIIHFFLRPSKFYLRAGSCENIRVVCSPLHGGLGARGPFKRQLQKIAIRSAKRILPEMLTAPFAWETYTEADAIVVLTEWRSIWCERFNASPARTFVIPNGVEEVFFQAPVMARGRWLVTTSSILPVKRIVETSKAAIAPATPYWVIGKPFSEADPYYQEFLRLSAQNPDLLRYEGAISDRLELARAYRSARGFVMLSKWENLSMSALEAARDCPLLLGDLPGPAAFLATRLVFVQSRTIPR